jgi:hypothetical protein
MNTANVTHRKSFEHLTARIAQDFADASQRPQFVVWGSVYPISSSGPTWWKKAATEPLPTIGLGWNVGSPLYHEQLEKSGISNIYRALFERPDIYCFGSQFDVENMAAYAREHFGEAIDSDTPRYYLYELNGPIQPAFFRVRKFSRIDPQAASQVSAQEKRSSR